MHFHKWSKWTQYDVDMVRINRENGAQYPFIEHHQKRHCEKCGKVQVEMIKVKQKW